MSIKRGYRELSEFISGYIIIINFLIKSVRIEPCVVERKNQFIFEQTIYFDVKYGQDIGLILKKCLKNLNKILKLCIILLT